MNKFNLNDTVLLEEYTHGFKNISIRKVVKVEGKYLELNGYTGYLFDATTGFCKNKGKECWFCYAITQDDLNHLIEAQKELGNYKNLLRC